MPSPSSGELHKAAENAQGHGPLKFFARFRPDGVTYEDLLDTGMVSEFLTGQHNEFPLTIAPQVEKLFDLAITGKNGADDLPATFHKSITKKLVEFVMNACWRLTSLATKQPQMMAEIARKLPTWPVIVSVLPNWEEEARRQVGQLSLGADVKHIVIPFRKAGGPDDNYPSRRWAKQGVYTVNTTRHLQRWLVAKQEKADKDLWDGCWRRADEPSWVAKAKELPDFSVATVPEWTKVIREMIREEMPDFHLRPEWENQRRSCTKQANDRNSSMTKGEIQNAVLDDIISALKTVTLSESSQTC